MTPGSDMLIDQRLNNLYPLPIRELARLHWTSTPLARKAAQFLAGDGSPLILDIGSGAGKFCLVAGHFTPKAHFVGIEQRAHLVRCAEDARIGLDIQNVSFIHGNFTQLDLGKFDHFYWYNPFYENLVEDERIDDQVVCSSALYDYYTRYLFRELRNRPSGTRLCTLCSLENEIPPEFHEAGSNMSGLLKYWVRE